MAEATCCGFVGGVVEDLDFELLARILHGADRFNQAINDKLLIEDGQLDRDGGQFVEVAGRVGVVVLAVLEVLVRHGVAMDAVEGEQDHHREVGQQHGGVKDVPVVEPLEGLVGVLHFEVVAESALRRKGQKRNNLPRRSGERTGNGSQSGWRRRDQGLSLRGWIGFIVREEQWLRVKRPGAGAYRRRRPFTGPRAIPLRYAQKRERGRDELCRIRKNGGQGRD